MRARSLVRAHPVQPRSQCKGMTPDNVLTHQRPTRPRSEAEFVSALNAAARAVRQASSSGSGCVTTCRRSLARTPGASVRKQSSRSGAYPPGTTPPLASNYIANLNASSDIGQRPVVFSVQQDRDLEPNIVVLRRVREFLVSLAQVAFRDGHLSAFNTLQDTTPLSPPAYRVDGSGVSPPPDFVTIRFKPVLV